MCTYVRALRALSRKNSLRKTEEMNIEQYTTMNDLIISNIYERAVPGPIPQSKILLVPALVDLLSPVNVTEFLLERCVVNEGYVPCLYRTVPTYVVREHIVWEMYSRALLLRLRTTM